MTAGVGDADRRIAQLVITVLHYLWGRWQHPLFVKDAPVFAQVPSAKSAPHGCSPGLRENVSGVRPEHEFSRPVGIASAAQWAVVLESRHPIDLRFSCHHKPRHPPPDHRRNRHSPRLRVTSYVRTASGADDSPAVDVTDRFLLDFADRERKSTQAHGSAISE